MPSAVVTGATGFIGNKLCSLLKEKEWTITATGRSNSKGPWDHFHECDLTTPNSQLPNLDVDAVFHLAGKAHALSEMSENQDDYFNINVRATERLVARATKASPCPRFVYFSSVKAMGEGNADYYDSGPISEYSQLIPSSPYGLSKLKAEEVVLQYPHATVIRPTMVYGPNSKGNLLKMARAIQKNRFPPIPEFGNLRSMVSVDDLCELALLVATSEKSIGKTYIAAEPEAYSTRKLYEMLSTELAKKPPSWRIPFTVLKGLGLVGNVIGTLSRRRFVFDTDALAKLTSSAWYDGNKCCDDLSFSYKHRIETEIPKMIASWRERRTPKEQLPKIAR